MNGVAPSDGHPPIAYFTEVVTGDATLRLAAAVVWRGVPARAALRGGGGSLGWLRSVRHRLWLRLGPLGADVSVAGRPLFGGAWGAARSVAGAAALAYEEPMAYYDDGARVLRVLGRVVSAPRERTLVALIDATGRRTTAPRVMLRVVSTPTVPMPQLDFTEPAGTSAGTFLIGGECAVWATALRADPVVGAFMSGNPTD
jgi:hypothetical protein